MAIGLRFEIFPDDIAATEDFYTRVLGFSVVSYQHEDPGPYLSMQRDNVRVGAALRPLQVHPEKRRPPVGVELVLEVDDVELEYERVCTSGWPVDDPLQERPWGLRDFRLVDPSGYYLRLTSRHP